jgi:hypothetical protein
VPALPVQHLTLLRQIPQDPHVSTGVGAIGPAALRGRVSFSTFEASATAVLYAVNSLKYEAWRQQLSLESLQ